MMLHKGSTIALIAGIIGACSLPALAQWSLDQGTAIAAPSETNSTAELLAVSCGDPVSLEIFARGGVVVPDGSDIQPDYYSNPAKVRTDVDGKAFALVAEETQGGVILGGKGTRANSIKPVGDDLIASLKTGSVLTIAFDAVPGENGPDGSPFETVARFPLDGASDALTTALASCQ